MVDVEVTRKVFKHSLLPEGGRRRKDDDAQARLSKGLITNMNIRREDDAAAEALAAAVAHVCGNVPTPVAVLKRQRVCAMSVFSTAIATYLAQKHT